MRAAKPTDTTRLLLIEKNPAARARWREALELSGHPFAVAEAATADDGLRLARGGHFDCILLDHAPPDCNGLAFLSDFREGHDDLPAPVVMVAPADDAAAAVRALKLGAADILVRNSPPAAPDFIPAAILKTLRERGMLREHRRVEEQLRQAEAKYRNLVELLPVITYIASLEEPGRLLSISPQVERLGRSREAWLNSADGLLSFVHADDRARVIEEMSWTYGNQSSFQCEYRLVDEEGQSHWFQDRASVVRGDDGRPLCLQGTLAETVRRLDGAMPSPERRPSLGARRAAATLAGDTVYGLIPEAPAAEPATHGDRFRLLLDSTGEGFLELDAEGRCRYANRAAVALFGYAPPEGLEGRNLDALLTWHRLSGDSRERKSPLHLTVRQGRPCRFVEALVRRDGQVFSAEISAHPIAGKAGAGSRGAVVVMRDVSDSKALAQRLRYQASHDALTGLLNRTEFERRLAKVIAAARRGSGEHTLCFLDLDRFKAINDRCGHAAGDQVLQSLALLLQSRLRQSDILARLGGDEFGLLLENCSIGQAFAIANELREAARGFRFPWAGEEFTVGLSIGMVALHAGSRDVASVVSAADAACYAAKKSGRDRIHLFERSAKDPGQGSPVLLPEPARTPLAVGAEAAVPQRASRAGC